MALRVDTIPFWLKPWYLLWAYTTAALAYGIIKLWRLTISFKYDGTDKMSLSGNNIYCIWHKNLVMNFMLPYSMPQGRKDVWMNHPAWFMKPIHIILHWKGVKHLVLGSSGNSGQEAKKGVEAYLQQGYSTTMAVDGPAGPPLIMKHGALQMALATGTPIICIQYLPKKQWVLDFTWDKKVVPVPFTGVDIKIHGPYYITPENYNTMVGVIERAM